MALLPVRVRESTRPWRAIPMAEPRKLRLPHEQKRSEDKAVLCHGRASILSRTSCICGWRSPWLTDVKLAERLVASHLKGREDE